MTCPNCGMEFGESKKICPVCGFELEAEQEEVQNFEETIVQENNSDFPAPDIPDNYQKASSNVTTKKKNSVVIILIIAVVVLLIAGIAIAAFFMNSNNKGTDSKLILENSSTTDTTVKKEITSETIAEETTAQTSADIETTIEETTTQITTVAETKVEETTVEDSGQYEIYYSADELLSEAGLGLGGHVCAAVVSNVEASSGKAEVKTEDVYGFANLISITVTGATEKEVVLSGTITTYGVDSYEGQQVTYSDMTGSFMYKKSADGTSADSPKSNNSSVQTYDLGEGFFGVIYAPSGRVDGLTTNYVVNGGDYEVQHNVQDGWRIIAETQCTSMGITWYECWDADDGDYYGWIDSQFLMLFTY